MGKLGRQRRKLEDEEVLRMVIDNPEMSNPFEKDDRRYKMFVRHKNNDRMLEDLMDVLGGRPVE